MNIGSVVVLFHTISSLSSPSVAIAMLSTSVGESEVQSVIPREGEHGEEALLSSG
jgi:hypothetical protein